MNISYKKSFLKNFEKYDNKLQKQIIESIEKLPEGDFIILKGKHSPPLFRLRVRSYRILFEMDQDNIIVWFVDSRGDVYKNI